MFSDNKECIFINKYPNLHNSRGNMVKNFIKLQDHQTIIVSVLSLGSTFVCLQLELTLDMPTGLVGVAIVFPIVFSINAAYRRREEALEYLAGLKSAGTSIFYAHRDWIDDENKTHANRVKLLLMDLLEAIREDFSSTEELEADNHRIYHLFSEISKSIELLRQSGLTAPDMSRTNQYLREMMEHFEKMRNIFVYRTPVSLRAYTQVFLNIFPVIFGPYFAYLSSHYFAASGYLVALLYGIVLTSLDNIQDSLENPYDGIGEDDVNLDIREDFHITIDRF